MDERTKKLIAVGVSVGANCHPCLKYHVGKARELGIECSEIMEAVEAGKAVRGGAAASKRARPEASGRRCARSLPDQYQSVIILSELEGMKDGEIAEILGVTLQAAKVRLHRARAKLRKELSEACVFYRDERNELACDRKNSSCK
jgi:AhpD family alkylhydroperoxidase